MKALYDHLKHLAESAAAPLFTSFQNDLYELDRDTIMHDLLPGDAWYWSIKECGTYLTLAHNENEYLQELLSPRHSPERRHFLIHITGKDTFEIKEYNFETLAAAVSKIKKNPGRVAPRQFGSEILFELEPALRGTLLMSDFTMTKGATLYLTLNNNSASYVTKCGKCRSIGLPFSFERKTGSYKITITDKFGHAVCDQIKYSVFARAQKSYAGKRAA